MVEGLGVGLDVGNVLCDEGWVVDVIVLKGCGRSGDGWPVP